MIKTVIIVVVAVIGVARKAEYLLVSGCVA